MSLASRPRGGSGLWLSARCGKSLAKIFRPQIKNDERLYNGPGRLISYCISRNWIIIIINQMSYSSNDVEVIWGAERGKKISQKPARSVLASTMFCRLLIV